MRLMVYLPSDAEEAVGEIVAAVERAGGSVTPVGRVGRPPVLHRPEVRERVEEALRAVSKGDISLRAAARKAGVSVATLSRLRRAKVEAERVQRMSSSS
jgi:DNA-binding LacI/PurR family transcriptional regulator